MTIKKIAIVGGGTAGWLAANHLGKELHKKLGLSITLIESPDIAPIGVGEGTVPDIKKTLASFGISETDFIKRCDVTFKQSIKFVNWLDQDKHGENNFFHHLFDVPHHEDSESLAAFWLIKSNNTHFAESLSPQFKVCEEGKAPKKISTPEYQEDLAYAYHLNAAKFADLLSENAQKNYGVEHLLTHINKVNFTDDGSICSLVSKEGKELAFDFYIDCSGFESLLISKAMKVPFIDLSDQLLVNTALVVQVPTDKNTPIPPYTVATAHKAGWVWDIALPNRRGVGFVYSNNHMSDEEAKTELDRYLGKNESGLAYKKIPMTIGYRDKFWHKNCVALGLAQGFLEPLEATSILLTDLSAKLLSLDFPDSKDDIYELEKRFNESMLHAWAKVVDFIKLHYCLSDREDSLFWSDNRDPKSISKNLKSKLDLWGGRLPRSEDFPSEFEVFYLENFLFVLYGMKFTTKIKGDSVVSADERLIALKHITEDLISALPQHRELLGKINKFGLQSI